MLKRQRHQSPFPSTPSANYDDFVTSLDSTLSVSERFTKRRRIESSLDQDEHPSSSKYSNEPTELSESEDDNREPEYYAGLNTRWQEQAGVYKESNTLLHDLHAEQRHRMLFASNEFNPAAACTPSPQSHASTARVDLPSWSSSTHHVPRVVTLHYGGDDKLESQIVTGHYEETNRSVYMIHFFYTMMVIDFGVGFSDLLY